MSLSDFQRIGLSFLPPRQQRQVREQFLETGTVLGHDLNDVCKSLKTRIDNDQLFCQKNKISLISCMDDRYPPLLLQIPDFPLMLYARGDLDCLLETSCLAIVGTRHATPYGLEQATHFAYDLANNGVLVVSGLAQGIDGAAHVGALQAGKTIAVVGTGIDGCFPASHRELMNRIVQNGLILSEFPLKTHGSKTTFPARNRIIAGLCRGVLVVESQAHGGSLITARLALEYNREVFALPGRINDTTCDGTLQLIRDGATLVRNINDIFTELRWTTTSPSIAVSTPPLSETETLILKHLSTQSMSLDDLNQHLNMPAGTLLSCLSQLEIKGVVLAEQGGYYRKLVRKR